MRSSRRAGGRRDRGRAVRPGRRSRHRRAGSTTRPSSRRSRRSSARRPAAALRCRAWRSTSSRVADCRGYRVLLRGIDVFMLEQATDHRPARALLDHVEQISHADPRRRARRGRDCCGRDVAWRVARQRSSISALLRRRSARSRKNKSTGCRARRGDSLSLCTRSTQRPARQDHQDILRGRRPGRGQGQTEPLTGSSSFLGDSAQAGPTGRCSGRRPSCRGCAGPGAGPPRRQQRPRAASFATFTQGDRHRHRGPS